MAFDRGHRTDVYGCAPTIQSASVERVEGGIYLRRNGELIALSEQPYATEDVLQSLLADHPGLLGGDQAGEAPRRWLLLSREVGIADTEGAAGRWSIDHLFVDQDAIPTLVEVKRSSDTRIRREVVGQLLEYAANGTRYWPVDELRALYEADCRTRGVDPEQELSERFGDEIDVDAWWDDVGANLKLGRLRLVFVADKISRELRRIIEFLNAQMTETEVLGVEIRQYVDAGNEHQTLVPRVIGQTEAARDTKTGGGRRPPKRTWDHESWMSVFAEVKPQQTPIVERLLAWAEGIGLTIQFGSGAHDPSMQFGYVDETVRFFPFFIHARGGLELPFTLMTTVYPPFERLELRRELRDRLNAIDGVEIPEDKLDKRPNFSVSALSSDEAFQRFTGAMEWAIGQARQTAPGGS